MTRHGFTLIELLAALALASILMLAAMEVTASLGIASDAMAQRATPHQWSEQVRALLQEDLAQAMEVEIDKDTIRITGPLGLDPQTLQRNHQPVRVTYRVHHRRGQAEFGLLLRLQQDLHDRTNRPAQRFLLAHGVSNFAAALIDSEPTAVEARDSVQATKQQLEVLLHLDSRDTTRLLLDVDRIPHE